MPDELSMDDVKEEMEDKYSEMFEEEEELTPDEKRLDELGMYRKEILQGFSETHPSKMIVYKRQPTVKFLDYFIENATRMQLGATLDSELKDDYKNRIKEAFEGREDVDVIEGTVKTIKELQAKNNELREKIAEVMEQLNQSTEILNGNLESQLLKTLITIFVERKLEVTNPEYVKILRENKEYMKEVYNSSEKEEVEM